MCLSIFLASQLLPVAGVGMPAPFRTCIVCKLYECGALVPENVSP